MRVEDWPERLAEVIGEHERKPFIYGVSDCLMFPAAVAHALTGIDPLPTGAREYSTRAEAFSALDAHGFANVGDAFASKFAEVPRSFAQRGDVGVIDHEGEQFGVVIVGPYALGKTEGGLIQVPLTRIKRAFRVE